MKPEVVVLLESEPEFLPLAISWHLVGRVGIATEGSIVRKWSVVSGVRPGATRRFGRVLRSHGVCLDDGSLDPFAKTFLEELARSRCKRHRIEPDEHDAFD